MPQVRKVGGEGQDGRHGPAQHGAVLPNASAGARRPGPWRRLRRKAREAGWLYTLQLSLEQLVPQRIFAVGKLLFTISDPRVRSAHELTDAEMQIVSGADFEAIAGAETWPPDLRAALMDGDQAGIFSRDGAIIAYRTFETNVHDQSHWLRFILPPDAVHIGDVWVRPDLRGRQIGVSSRNVLARYHADKGVRCNFSLIDALNRNSLRAHEKFGGGYLGALFYIRLFGLTLVRTNGTFKLGAWGPKHPLEIRIDLSGGRIDRPASMPRKPHRR